MNARQLEHCTAIKTELESYLRMTPQVAHERTKDPREPAGWSCSTLTILGRRDALLEALQGELKDDPDAVRWADLLLRFDREQVRQGVRSILEIVLAKAAGETRTAIEKTLAEAATFSRMVLEHVQRMEQLRATAEKAAGSFPGHKIELSPEVRKAVMTLAKGIEPGGVR